jgi:hypothetical protein
MCSKLPPSGDLTLEMNGAAPATAVTLVIRVILEQTLIGFLLTPTAYPSLYASRVPILESSLSTSVMF